MNGYVSILYGNTAHACSLAISAENLKILDPGTARIIHVWNISSETEDVLKHGWKIQQVKSPGDKWWRKLPVLESKLKRVVFFDSDNYVMPGANMKSLWKLPHNKTYALEDWPKHCFNGGFLIFTPTREAIDKYMIGARLKKNAPNMSSCRFDEQKVLNYVYPDWEHVPRELVSKFAIDQTPCFQNVADAENASGMFHFYGRTVPWGTNCMECIMAGTTCNVKLMRRRGRINPSCGHNAIQSLWYSNYLRLPKYVRKICYKRLKSTEVIYHADSRLANFTGCDLPKI